MEGKIFKKEPIKRKGIFEKFKKEKKKPQEGFTVELDLSENSDVAYNYFIDPEAFNKSVGIDDNLNPGNYDGEKKVEIVFNDLENNKEKKEVEKKKGILDMMSKAAVGAYQSVSEKVISIFSDKYPRPSRETKNKKGEIEEVGEEEIADNIEEDSIEENDEPESYYKKDFDLPPIPDSIPTPPRSKDLEEKNDGESLKNEYKKLELEILNRMNADQGVADLKSKLDSLVERIDNSVSFRDKGSLQDESRYLKKEIDDYYSKYKNRGEAIRFDEEKARQDEERESLSGNNNPETEDEPDYGDVKYKEGDERFKGENKYYKDFVPKDERGSFAKWKANKKLKQERKSIVKEYKKNVRSLNDKFFQDLLGADRLNILRKLSGDEKRVAEKKMIDQIINNETDPVEKKNIKAKYDEKIRVENTLAERENETKKQVKLQKERRKYSRQVEDEIKRTKDKMKDLKVGKFELFGDKEYYKDLKTKLEMLKEIPREKENRFSKFSKEQLANRRKILESPEMEAFREKYRKEIKKNLLDAGGKVFTGVGTLLSKPFIGLWGGLTALSPSKALLGFAEGVGVGLVEGGGDILKAFFKLLNAIVVLPIKAGFRYDLKN